MGIDGVVLSAFRRAGRNPDADALGLMYDRLVATQALHENRGWLGDPRAYLVAPPPMAGHNLRDDKVRGLPIRHLTWPSSHRPNGEEPGADRWVARRRNRTASAWLVETTPDAPWLVCIHGMGGGLPRVDNIAFHVRDLSTRLGVNLALPVLPRHGTRGTNPLDGFLTPDLVEGLFGTAQAVSDIRQLICWLRTDRGAERIGVYGMSLGSYITAVLGGVEEGLDMVMAGIPLVDIPELLRFHTPEQDRLAAHETGALGELADIVMSTVSPLSVAPLAPASRRFVYAGTIDRLTTKSQANRLIDHWDARSPLWYDGGHVGFVWNRQVKRFIDDALWRTGLVDSAVHSR